MRALASKVWAVIPVVVLIGGPTPGSAGTVKTYSVDCTKGESINAALANNGDELIIEIKGMCAERVIITRNRVTLRGSNPAADGILGVADGEALVEVWNADNAPSVFGAQTSVNLENLGIRGDDAVGLVNYDSSVGLTNCRLTDHLGNGLHLSGSGYAFVTDSEFARNAGVGINVQRNSRLICERCLFDDNEVGLQVISNGEAFLGASAISGTTGVIVAQQGRVLADTTDVTAADFALFVSEGGRLQWHDSTLSGSVAAQRQGYLRLVACDQVAAPVANRLFDGARALVQGGALLGVELGAFSTARVFAGASVGDLVCSSGADVFCDGSESKLSSSCGLCP